MAGSRYLIWAEVKVVIGFLGIDPVAIQKLAASGILNADQMLSAGSTPEKCAVLAQASGVSEANIIELVKLSDLVRLPGVKAVRARLYYDAGVDTVEKLASYEPAALLALTTDFVQRTGLTASLRCLKKSAQPLPRHASCPRQ